MTIGMYSPYLPKHFGGGERHFLTTAAYLTQKHKVEILIAQIPTDLAEQVKQYESRFNLDLSQVQWRASALASGQQSAFDTWRETKKYDAFFYLTDGSLFFNGSACGVVHVQIPFSQRLGLTGKLKLSTWKVLNTNSEFTKRVIEKSWGRKVDVIHVPFVDHSNIPSTLPEKKNEIVTVGRVFAEGKGHNKKQDVLIKAFIEGCQKYGWDKRTKLHVAGAIEPGAENEAYAQSLRKLAKDWPVVFHFDVSFNKLEHLYAQCRVYWHAAGFEVDEDKFPEKVEHFGITPLEAIAWGCIPIVVPKGGIPETITPEETGLTYQSIEQLIEQTQRVLTFSNREALEWQTRVRAASQKYSLSRFCQTIDEMIGQPVVL